MRHAKKRNKLGRDSAHRKALLSNLSKEIIEHERIKTSQAKAKAAKPEIEKLITLGKRGDLHARRQALSVLRQDKFAVHKLFEEIAPRYEDRQGGYTRIVKIAPRKGDNAPMCVIELVREPVNAKPKHAVVAEAEAATKRSAKDAETTEDAGTDAAPETAVELPKGAVAPNEDGSAPEGYTVKGNADSGLYHEPDGQWYDQTVAEFWFASADDAEAAGFKKAGSGN